jgi:hypothetical protein
MVVLDDNLTLGCETEVCYPYIYIYIYMIGSDRDEKYIINSCTNVQIIVGATVKRFDIL